MKPLSKLERKWREEEKLFLEYAAHPDNPEASKRWKAVAKEKGICADELQAWLREADRAILQNESGYYRLSKLWIRRELFGTTRTEGKK